MDQLRMILGHIKKQHFWLLCVACLIAGFVGSMMAASKISAAYSARKGAINGRFSALETINQVKDFPNATWKGKVEELTNDEKKKVRAAWQLVYNEQAQVLKWPEYLGPKFLKAVQQPGRPELGSDDREVYATRIGREFPKLLEIIGAEQQEASKSGSVDKAAAAQAASERAPGEMQSEDRVIWEGTSQQHIQERLRFAAAPSSPEVYLTQEDLWVYQTLLTIIKNVNAERFVPPVREIKDLYIGQRAAEAMEVGLGTEFIETPKTAAAASGGPPVYAPPPPRAPTEAPSSDDGRYVDAGGKRQGTAAVASSPFKRMPVYMKLVMDQREVAKLLVECANSPLPVEVCQLRVNPTKGNEGSGAAPSSNRRDSPAGGSTVEHVSYDVPVAICGIIYIYNPPDVSKLGADVPAGAGDPAAAPPPAAPGG